MEHLPDYAEHLIRARRATRAFRPDAVPEETLRAVFSLAGAAPSNSNTQPWHIEVVSGAARERLGDALVEAHAEKRLSMDFPYHDGLYQGTYQRRRQQAGERMYSAVGIGREDRTAREAYNAESLRFYGAPHVALLFTAPNAEARMAADVGIYAQTLMLAMTAHGIASCPQGLLGFYADTVRAELGVENRKLLLGISFGYADATAPANRVRIPRAELDETTRFHA
ncbi:nitroreductase [Amycolatopsis sp. CA-230715]|uniref:nitroreductase n=1 Tax=Amycolatopsis sp. CA-230715 TaxID=2745196 RepID=UPI001C337877|nr:nitroreductase [Amycolatopsis sp. CA-230715]QWF78608.1 Nitroreductase NfnB [Amycolatopsis sp. CA-230715]